MGVAGVSFIARLGTGVKRGFVSTGRYFKESWSELKKVRWPNRKELRNYTAIVLVTVLLMAIFFGLVDLGLSFFLDWILK